ncbi:helix-turn-helix transcriptional regulator [Dyella acidiphila]|uniref:Helix-turn-helix transcriptional regulator n=1 Tax=Dyella acidiphila TaxID=2775866 RepID=A0ABR9GD93_9GAMM|nr:helix-turn-helix transcriptional regulator [Dyella acidiphila]MBE1161999.1 helix-turn-helix transcriptional regulator [Dyella acidiphila]
MAAAKARAKPHVDRHQLQQIIAGLTEGVLLIDPDRSIVWANETALAIHGVEQLRDLGANAGQYRKKFILKYRNHHLLTHKQYPIERLLAGELFRDVIVEVTKADDESFCRVHQVRSLILTDSAGNNESLVLIMQDVTERFSAEDRFERAFSANPAPALICQLSDLRYVKVNQGFLDMTGYDRAALINHTAYEVDVLESAEKREEAVQNLHAGRTISQREAELRLPNGDSKFVIVAGQPIEVDDADCMLFTFIDLEARKKAEVSLSHSEERFSKAFRLAPVPMMVCARPELRILEVNTAFSVTMGFKADDLLGKTTSDAGLWADVKLYRDLQLRLETQDELLNFEIPLRTSDDAVIDCLFSSAAVMIQGEACVLCVLQNITERKRSEMDLIAAIEAVMKDASWFSRNVMEKLAQIRRPGETGKTGSELSDLTPREKEVLSLICRGHSDSEIAAALKLSRNTVRNHISTLYGKIGVNRRSAAVIWGRERGIISY